MYMYVCICIVIFNLYDVDRNGFISIDELAQMLSSIDTIEYPLDDTNCMAGTMTHIYMYIMCICYNMYHYVESIYRMFEKMDANGDGKISLEEFTTVMMADPVLQDRLIKSF